MGKKKNKNKKGNNEKKNTPASSTSQSVGTTSSSPPERSNVGVNVSASSSSQSVEAASSSLLEGSNVNKDAPSSSSPVDPGSLPEQKITTKRPKQTNQPSSSSLLQVESASSPSKSSVSLEQNIEEDLQETEITTALAKSTIEESIFDQGKSKEVIPFARRQPKGKFGKPIKLIANYFPLSFKDITVFHYDIDIKMIKRNEKDEKNAEGDGDKKRKGNLKGEKKGKSIIMEETSIRKDSHKGITRAEHQQERRLGKELCRKIMWKLFGQQINWDLFGREEDRKKPCYYVYDGRKNLYTTKKLPIQDAEKGVTFIVELPDELHRDPGRSRCDFCVIIRPAVKKSGNYEINLKSLKELNVNYCEELCQESILVLDTVMCHRNPKEIRGGGVIEMIFPQIQVGRSFFELTTRKENIKQGLELWHGYNQSVRPTERGPAVVVNFAAKPFVKAVNALRFASEVLDTDITELPSLTPYQIKLLGEAFKKIKIEVTHLPYRRKYIVSDLTETSVKNTRRVIDGREMSIAEYFQTKYPHKRLRFTHLPCLKMNCSNATKTEPPVLPMEVCDIVSNQPKFGNIPPEATRSMILKTAITPIERFNKILESGKLICTDGMSGNSMVKFGLSMELNFMQLSGRVLDSPNLLYNTEMSKFPVKPDDCGRWRIDRNQFIKSLGDFSWILINFDRGCSMAALKYFVDELCKKANDLGMNIRKKNLKDIKSVQGQDQIKRELRAAKEMEVKLAVLILPGPDKTTSVYYEEIKSIAEPELKLLTQCVRSKTLRSTLGDLESKKTSNLGYQKLGNILNKINMKLGGVNHKLNQPPKTFNSPFIVFGADTVHSPRGSNRPSIASIVGSLDAYAARYAATCRIQYPDEKVRLSQEIILELDNMIHDILTAFTKTNANMLKSRQVERILFFRDGVSEGQFDTVLQEELPLVRKACTDILGYIPKITFIIVQKKHQTRLRPENSADGIGKGQNVPPGTTVDSDIVHPRYFNFFLCSHEGIQGTSKPAHYIVLYDDNNFSADELQKLCFYLCYLYVNCNRSISIPAPVMYADLACTRAKVYVDNYLNKKNLGTGRLSDDEKPELPQDIKDKITGMKDCTSMYFI